METLPADVTVRADVERLRRWHCQTLIHLAAVGRVVTDLHDVPNLFNAALCGTVNLLQIIEPRTLVLASSCAIYGNTLKKGATPNWSNVHAFGPYGLSKAALETTGRIWAEETGNSTVNLRLGNVIGRGCGGLISYLVRHAARYPDGSRPASMRGGGRIRRDYVPIEYVGEVIRAAANHKWKRGSTQVFNVGTGRGFTNGEIAEITQSLLSERGFSLRIDWRRDPAPGEAQDVRLDIRATTRKFGIEPPTTDQTRTCITDTILSALGDMAPAELETADASH